MPDSSTRLSLPYLLPSQAQKHVTHNEALERLDLLVQLTVVEFGATTPPTVMDEGQIWALGPVPSGIWADQPDQLAAWVGGAWIFISPQPGWRAAQGSDLRIWSGTEWVVPEHGLPETLPGLGINTNHDTVNRLAVVSEATLLSHDGHGHQLKINKATENETASLLFQTAWSGRAEMGTTGSDMFEVKVSPDGTVWHTAMNAAPATGRAIFPNGATIDGNLSGSAVTASASDTTADRVLRVGAGHQQLDPTLYRRGNILGTVSQSGGDPTGAIIQRGSNSNGEFVRFADGTQICTHRIELGTIQTASGGVFVGSNVNWTFPASFAAAPRGVSSNVTATNSVTSFIRVNGANAATVNGVAWTSTSAERSADVMAVGRWF